MNFIDTHAHLDAFETPQSLAAALKRARDANVNGVITCSARRQDWELYEKISRENKGNVWWQFGIHPTEVSESDADTLEKDFERFMNSDTPPVSVGEIGLDFYRLPTDEAQAAKEIETQKLIFKLQLKLAKSAGLPICVHARSAIRESIEIISESGFDFSKAVLHCFSGSANDVKILNELGARASFTGIITYKNAGEMRDAMLAQGLSKLMLETDCPYLAPVPHRGETNEPAYIPLVAKKAAEVFGVAENEIADITTQNAREFFKL